MSGVLGQEAARFPAPAKVNLYLRVTALLDDGMHELDTAFAYTDLCDQIHLRASEQLSVRCSDPQLDGEKNLVYRVLDAFRRLHRIDAGLAVYVEKRIPAQAGLGGGSSDAATALMVANRQWRVGATTEELIRFATPFGADIPCFLFRRASRATGVGECLRPYREVLPQGALLLARPDSGLSTAAVFRHFDRALTAHSGVDTIRRDLPRLSENDLQASATLLNPDVARLLAEMRDGASLAWMSGSGSACVALLDDAAQARRMAQRLLAQGVASWTHVGRLCAVHPLSRMIDADVGT